MNDRERLIAKINPQTGSEIVVSLEDFFTGNQDLGSIGCNLGEEQPPLHVFFETLRDIRNKPDVQDVLVRIFDYDDPTSWPFSETVYIITSAPLDQVKQWVAILKPDEIYPEWMYGKPPHAPEVNPGMTPYSIWWD